MSPLLTPSDHKNQITDHCCSLEHSINGTAMLQVSQYYHKRQWKPTSYREGKVHVTYFFIFAIFLNAVNISFEAN